MHSSLFFHFKKTAPTLRLRSSSERLRSRNSNSKATRNNLFLFNAEIEDYSSFVLDSIKKGDRGFKNARKLKGSTGRLVVQEYEQEELADNSEDEKRIILFSSLKKHKNAVF